MHLATIHRPVDYKTISVLHKHQTAASKDTQYSSTAFLKGDIYALLKATTVSATFLSAYPSGSIN